MLSPVTAAHRPDPDQGCRYAAVWHEGTQFADLDADTGNRFRSIRTSNHERTILSLSFDAEGRQRLANTTQTVNVYWNGALIDSFDPSGTSYQTYTPIRSRTPAGLVG